MPIRSYLTEEAAFDREAIHNMDEAFEHVCESLDLPPDDEQGRRIIATRIIDLARTGILDAEALRDTILQEAKAEGVATPPQSKSGLSRKL